ncbi:MAG: winged helix DNA-binding domain-containing protein [Chloroflexi bacterium]|nr:winged helix DNA-binding domain-containing protein [Chloroflexota bacterium]MCI0576643.1 winged helix DNA-binding domain-containing protein [Chloroflexota bacterium]
MDSITISKTTARRFVLGRQGLWPGRRWAGKEGTAGALRTMEALQMDPLNIVARSHDIALWGRVIDYRPEYLDQLLYQDRAFFDYGGGLFIYPMSELPFWRVPMRHRESDKRWAEFAASHPALLEEVRAELRQRGPLGNRDFAGHQRVDSYRGRKDSSLALYYLWLTGELMIHHREGFERVYDFRDHVAPPALNYAATLEEAEQFFGRKITAFIGLISERGWANGLAGFIERRMSHPEARQRLDTLLQQGVMAPVQVEGEKEQRYVLSGDLPLLATLEAGQIPEAWWPLGTTTGEEAVFLAPLEIASARGRATRLFDFEYLWEVYKPAAKRRWGYYTLPVLYGDRLVARLDPKLDRATATLLVNGFWLETHAPAGDPAFAAALACCFARFAAFLQAGRVNLSVVEPSSLRAQVAAGLLATPGGQLDVVQ